MTVSLKSSIVMLHLSLESYVDTLQPAVTAALGEGWTAGVCYCTDSVTLVSPEVDRIEFLSRVEIADGLDKALIPDRLDQLKSGEYSRNGGFIVGPAERKLQRAWLYPGCPEIASLATALACPEPATGILLPNTYAALRRGNRSDRP